MNRIWRALGLLLAAAFLTAAQATPLTGHIKPKWTQLPDMEDGTDFLSMHRTNGPVVADDFQSDGRPIVGFHWWGSYFQDDPLLQPGQDRQVRFEISFHPDCPAGADCNQDGISGDYPFSTPGYFAPPGQPGSYLFQIVTAEEDFFGTTAAGERVYEYWALLPDPWEEIAGNIYWVDIAWDASQAQDPNANIWGWHESFQHWNDSAVQTRPPSPGGNPHLGAWGILRGEDMAFEVLTIPVPGTLLLLGLGLAGLGAWRVARRD